MNAALSPSSGERRLAAWRSPLSFTALVPIPQFSERDLRELLRELAPKIREAASRVDDLHSFRLVIVPGNVAGVRSLHLLLNLVHDRPLDEHLVRLIAVAGQPLAQAFAGAGLDDGAAGLAELWGRHRVRENTVHLGAIGRRLSDIRSEQILREEIGVWIDRRLAEKAWNAETSAETIRRETRDYVNALGGRGGLPTGPASDISPEGRCARFRDLLLTFTLFPMIGVLWTDIGIAIRRIADRRRRRFTWMAYRLWWIYGAFFTGVSLLVVRALERFEGDVELPPADAAKVQRLEDLEDLSPKNEVTYWFTVRETWIRRVLLAVILFGSERGCRHFWTDGKLAGIDTIHYARIMRVARSRVMLFMSDYDGSLDRYLLDFTGVGSRAVIPIASNVAGSPKTRWLYGEQDVATFAPRLRNVLRTYQLEPSVWYNAYPLLTVRDILVNGVIRKGLFAQTMAEEEAQRWADLL